MRIQLIATNFAPEHTGIAPYVTALAEHLSREHEVTVIAGWPHYPQWRVTPGWRSWRSEVVEGNLRTIRLAHYVPGRQDAGRRAAYESSWAVRALAEGTRHRADVVLGVIPTLLTASVAGAVARRRKAGLGIVVQDIVSRAAAQSGIKGGGRVAGATARIERFGLGLADGVCTIHPRLADVLTRDYGVAADRIHVIYNWSHNSPPTADRQQTRANLNWSPEETVVLHSGNMGLKQNLEHVVAAARLAQSAGRPVRFVLAGDGSQRNRLEGCAIADYLDVRPGVAQDEFPDFLAAADVLLVNERAGVSEMSVPSKLTSYFAAGRPVVAATEATSPTADLVQSSGAGIVTPPDDPGRLLDAVTALGQDTGLAQQMGQRGQSFAMSHLSAAAALSSYQNWATGFGGK